MVFSSISFLFFFLPILLGLYFLLPKKFNNYILLIFSLIFYFLGEKWYLFLLLFSCFINYILGILIGKKSSKKFFVIGLIFNIGMLIYFKYTNFLIDNFNNIFNFNLMELNIILPLGISFFTFQNISYLIDVFKGNASYQKNILKYMLYITMFPQLVAGPIVRYKDINKEIDSRTTSYALFSKGVLRFTLGIGKKVIIADTLFHSITVIQASNMTTFTYWLVGIMYTLQIYYDFSGYSDMAIGLGSMFGFNFLENFNYPLISKSITDFWRRWHISLSSFFKDYVYIPLGGSKVGVLKNIRNILIVWLLTGLWHGSNWNFIIWGLYFFIFLILEKFILNKIKKVSFLNHLYTLIVIIISFVIFNITDLKELLEFLKGMFGLNTSLINYESIYYLRVNIVILSIAIVGATPILKNIISNLKKGKYRKILNILEIIYFLIVFFIAISMIVSSSFSPFIYFRF